MMINYRVLTRYPIQLTDPESWAPGCFIWFWSSNQEAKKEGSSCHGRFLSLTFLPIRYKMLDTGSCLYFIGRKLCDFANFLDVHASLSLPNCTFEVTCKILIENRERFALNHKIQQIHLVPHYINKPFLTSKYVCVDPHREVHSDTPANYRVRTRHRWRRGRIVQHTSGTPTRRPVLWEGEVWDIQGGTQRDTTHNTAGRPYVHTYDSGRLIWTVPSMKWLLWWYYDGV